MLDVLVTPGHVLAPSGQARWPAFVLDTCRALGGPADSAYQAAAAVELVTLAADLVDDLVDGDLAAGHDAARILNATHVLAWLGQACALELAPRVGHQRAALIARTLVRGTLAAHGGEDLDLALETDAVTTEEAALDMTGRKSGSLVAMACRVGAALATGDPATLDRVGDFGYRTGIVAQLLNDMAGVDVDSAVRGSDLRRRKKTLPVAFLLRCAREEGPQWVLDLYARGAPPSRAQEQRLAVLIHDVGGLHYTWTVADAVRREALAVLDELARVTGRQQVLSLRRLVPSVHARGFGDR